MKIILYIELYNPTFWLPNTPKTPPKLQMHLFLSHQNSLYSLPPPSYVRSCLRDSFFYLSNAPKNPTFDEYLLLHNITDCNKRSVKSDNRHSEITWKNCPPPPAYDRSCLRVFLLPIIESQWS